jgi:hypothetical protein
VTLSGAALVLALAGAACTSSVQPTPIYVYTSGPATPTPAATPATPAPTLTLMPTPVATPVSGATLTPLPTDSPNPTPTPEPAATPTPAPSSGPTSPAAACTGKAANQAWFLEASKNVKITVYCATKLGTGWGLASTPQTSWGGGKSGGTVLIYYQYRTTTTRLELCQGAFSGTDCAATTGAIGNASLGGLSGELDTVADGFAIRVAPGTSHAYTLVGHHMTQVALVAVGANLKVVPKA